MKVNFNPYTRMKEFFDYLSVSIHNLWSIFTGLVSATLGYFLPVKNIVNLLILFFIIDVLFGYLAAKKIRKEKFSAKIIWNTTMPRMIISMVLIIMAFMWDDVYSQNFVATYKLIGWFISGVLLFSIIQNAYEITNWEVLPGIKRILRDKGLDVYKKESDDDDRRRTN